MLGRAAITGSTQIDVTAMCVSVWNMSCFAQRNSTLSNCSVIRPRFPFRSDAVHDERDQKQRRDFVARACQ